MSLLLQLLEAYEGIDYGLLCIVGFFCLVACMLLVVKENKQKNKTLSFQNGILCFIFALYLSFMLGGTLLNRLPDPIYEWKLIPFWSYWEMIVNKSENMWKQILYNIVVFVPWGILLPLLYTKARQWKITILSATIFSLVIELIQLIFRLGFFEFDDIFNNVLGTFIGFGIWKLVSKRTRKAISNE